MDELLQPTSQPLLVLRLCLPRLTPKDMCMLRCTCSVLRDMRVSWQGHSIDFQLDGSISATSWLHKNIVSMRCLSLGVSLNTPERMVQDIIGGVW